MRRFGDFFRRFTTPPHPPESDASHDPIPSKIGIYQITGRLGRGGMGIVYSARDPRLDRTVAIKVMAAHAMDEEGRARFRREARAAASVNHPNIAAVYEVGEHQGELYLAMELLDGESLADRLRDGPLTVAETIPIGVGILDALAALHARGVIHRDLKPSNVFLTRYGTKLLDFGLARPIQGAPSMETSVDLTRPGFLVGTPRYIAPEQITGEPVDGRCDLFATGAILFEMLAGRPAFQGNNVVEILHATLSEQPPCLAGSPAVIALDRVIHRAIAKKPANRPPTAEAMAADLRAVDGSGADDTSAALARTLIRLVVLPFRVLRPDPETDFLAFSLPDAIATSLSHFGSLIVRSTTSAARFATESPDLKALAAEADVDRVVTGTILRSGDQLRITAQLVEAPGGTLLTSHTSTSSLGDLFRLQDDLAHRIVDVLSLPLAGPPSTPDAPRDARAYALYLEGKALAQSFEQMPQARDHYQESVDLDPKFAPAWAELGRTLRVIGKFMGGPPGTEARAEAALIRALELNPRLMVAHKYYAYLESDAGRPLDALTRLLDEAGRHGNDPELFAGLVHACRYCGLFEESLAAHEEARRLDRNVPTSLEETLLLSCEYEKVLAVRGARMQDAGEDLNQIVALGMLGRDEEARGVLRAVRGQTRTSVLLAWADYMDAWLDRRPDEMLRIRAAMGGVKILEDPEAMFQEGYLVCYAGDKERGLEIVRRAVTKGYFVVETLTRCAAFDRVRDDAVFRQILAEAVAGRDRALLAFRERGGEKLLGAVAA